MSAFIDIANHRFGMLVALSRDANTKHKQATWLCACDCGKEKVIPANDLRQGKTTSCGCLRAKKFRSLVTSHGKRYTREYRIWCNMKSRCTNPNFPKYAAYGARGITICAEWQADFSAFLADMGPAPSDKHSIDRIDNDGPYERGNCRWATAVQQANNKRRKSA